VESNEAVMHFINTGQIIPNWRKRSALRLDRQIETDQRQVAVNLHRVPIRQNRKLRTNRADRSNRQIGDGKS